MFLILIIHCYFRFLQEGTQVPSKTAHEFQVLVAKAAESLMEKVGVSEEVIYSQFFGCMKVKI